MGERVGIANKMPEATSKNSVPHIQKKTESSQSINSPVDRILYLQRTIGNQGVAKLVKSGALQTKLRLGQPGDIYEQEADRVADQVMRMPDISRQTADSRIQRKCPKCEEELQAKETRGDAPEVTPHIEADISSIRGGGQPLSESVRAFMEPRFGHDFGNVRVHTDAKAAESAQAVNALAYTVGQDVVFGAGQYAPGTSKGDRLLAHELAHVVQQRQTSGSDYLQRACGHKKIGPTPPGCTLVSAMPKGERFLFNVNCDEFAPGQKVALETFASTIPPTATINILGLASFDGPPEFNESLSCHRAFAAASIFHDKGLGGNIRHPIQATGGVPGTASDPNFRAVDIEVLTPPAPIPPSCKSFPCIGTSRCLTVPEVTAATSVFGSSLDLTRIRITDSLGAGGAPWTNFSISTIPPFASGTCLNLGKSSPTHTLIHELTHSWQSQHHSDPAKYMINSVESQALSMALNKGNRGCAYTYILGAPFGDYAAEQIAQIVEDDFLGKPGLKGYVSTISSTAIGAASSDNVTSLSKPRIGPPPC